MVKESIVCDQTKKQLMSRCGCHLHSSVCVHSTLKIWSMKRSNHQIRLSHLLKLKSLIVKAQIGPTETEKTNKQSASKQPLLIYDCHLHIPHSCITSYQPSHSDCCRNVHVKAHILNVGVVHTHNDWKIEKHLNDQRGFCSVPKREQVNQSSVKL